MALKYIEYKKFSCKSESTPACDFCSKHPLKTPDFDRPPTPVPDGSRLPKLHYLPLSKTPVGSKLVDEYNPRTNVTSLFQAGQIKLGDEAAVRNFSKSYAVDEKHVRNRLEHLETLLLTKQKKAQKKKQLLICPVKT